MAETIIWDFKILNLNFVSGFGFRKILVQLC